MIFSNAPYAGSGYGTQAAQLGRTLRRHGHEVAFAAYWGLHGTSIQFDGFPVYPGSGEDAYARDVLPGHYAHFKADLLITLMDIWVFEPEHLKGMNVAHWMPVDCSPLSHLDRKTLAGGGRPIALSRFGQKQLQDAGYEALYAPHALDMSVWSPLEDRDRARTHLGFGGKFVIGINAANQDPERKGYYEQLAAFAEFSKRHDDARMLIHTRVNTQQGVDINEIIAQLGIRDKAVPGDQYAIAAGMIGDGQMVSWHGVMDLLSNCSYAEGFGLPVLQSQATGVPVVVTDFSAMPELCGAGWKVKGQRKWNRGHNAKWCVPSIPGIIAAYEKAYAHARDPQMRDKARRFALRYDADRVYEKYWKPILEQLAPGAGRPAGKSSSKPRTVWSPVMFRDELDMLEMRLAETGDLADRHVLAESGLTHRGVRKPLAYMMNAGRFAPWADRISNVVAELDPEGDPWANEHAQRDAAWPAIDAEASDSDIVLISDVDEIPSRSLLERARAGQLPEVCSVRMRTTLHAVDWEVPQDAVPPTCVIATAGYIRRNGGSLAAVRDRRDSYPVIEDGGWHFSWTGGPEAAREKLETATCHTELLTDGEGPLIADGTRYRTGEGAGGLPVVPAAVDGTWPAWIRDRKCPPSWLRPGGASVPMGDAALVITCWRRPDYLERTLASWAAVPEVKHLRRIIVALGRSDREDEMRAVIAASGLDAEVRPDSDAAAAVNGEHTALAEAIDAALADRGCGFAVASSEDIVVSDDVLRYFAWARTVRTPEVLAVCAHNELGQGWHPHHDDSGADQDAARLAVAFNPWCWGTWRERWLDTLRPQWDWDQTSGPNAMERGWDWQAWRIMHQGWLAVTPEASRAQNIGQHEGVYANPADFPHTVARSFREHRGEVAYRLREA